MTRYAPDTVIACPACGQPGRLKNLHSLNTYGTRQWSDGYWEGLVGTRPALTRCKCCECIYWIQDAPVLGRYPRIPKKRGLAGVFQRWFAPEGWEPDPVNIPLDWERAGQVEDLDLRNRLGVVVNDTLAPERESTLRQSIWHRLNEAERQSRTPYPHEIELIQQHRGPNLERLLALADGAENPIRLQRGEILRELGRFNEAVAIFKTIQGESQYWAERLIGEAEQGSARVVVLREHGW